MKSFLIAFFLLITSAAVAQTIESNIITKDIDHFWEAYDQIKSTTDSTQKLKYLDQHFLSKASPGQIAMMQVRNYSPQSYINAIDAYPLFWESIRTKMFKAKGYSREISDNIEKLRNIYPGLKPSKIYFTVGAFRSGGTTLDSMVLIGSEISMADDNLVSTEFNNSIPGLIPFFKSNPVKSLVFTNVHEYIHTQQISNIGNTLLAASVMEGIAEFLAEKATGKLSTMPAISYGRKNEKRIKEVFSGIMHNPHNGFWLYSNTENEFGMRDMGYYTGYAISEGYYQFIPDKSLAIKQMIELDFNNPSSLAEFVDKSAYFNKPVATLAQEFDALRPIVRKVEYQLPKKLNDSILQTFTIHFSEEMDQSYRNFELGPLGEDALLRISNVIGFSENGKSLSFQAEIRPNRLYQIEVGYGFRNLRGIALKPYLFEIKTDNQ